MACLRPHSSRHSVRSIGEQRQHAFRIQAGFEVTVADNSLLELSPVASWHLIGPSQPCGSPNTCICRAEEQGSAIPPETRRVLFRSFLWKLCGANLVLPHLSIGLRAKPPTDLCPGQRQQPARCCLTRPTTTAAATGSSSRIGNRINWTDAARSRPPTCRSTSSACWVWLSMADRKDCGGRGRDGWTDLGIAEQGTSPIWRQSLSCSTRSCSSRCALRFVTTPSRTWHMNANSYGAELLGHLV